MSRPAHRRRRFWPCVAALALLAGSCLAPEGTGADKASPADRGLVRPAARRRIPIKDYEHASQSPWGNGRIGGTDDRRYAISPDGKRLATMDAGAWQLELWDLEKARSLGRFGRFGDSAAVAFSPDGKRLYSVGGGHAAAICSVDAWDVPQTLLIRSLDEGVNLTPFGAAAVSPDGKILALANVSFWNRREKSGRAIHLWDSATGEEIRRLGLPGKAPDRYRTIEGSLAYSPSGRMLALTIDGRVSLIEVLSGQERCLLTELPSVWRRGAEDESGGGCKAAAFSPDGKTLALGCNDGFVRLYDVRSGEPLAPLSGHEGRVEALRFTGSNTLLSFGFDRDLLTWPVAEARNPPGGPSRLSDAELRRYWEELGAEDARKAYLAAHALAAAPASALPFLGKRLAPVAPIDATKARDLIRRIREGEYPDRREAAAELARIGEDVLPIVSEEIAADQKRGVLESPALKSVADRLKRASPSPDRLRALRSLQALELMKGDESRKLLAALAKGAPGANSTVEAKAALDRIAARYIPTPDVPVEVLWDKLGSEDARAAFAAIRELTGRPATVGHISKELLALARRPEDETVVPRLIRQLGEEDFAKREAASVALRKQGGEAAPALRAALRKSQDVEQKQRLKAALVVLDQRSISTARLRADRALEVLHAIGTEEARRTLALLAREAKPRWLREAAGSLLAPAK